MKKYFLLSLVFLFASYVSAESGLFFSGALSCPVYSDSLDNFGFQKSEMENTKQQLKSVISEAYTKIHISQDKSQKDELKEIISLQKKQLMLLNYRLLILYKNQYLFNIKN